tara:strand:+ start:566 stop:1612 length:1047 start_codon:yes stop_codon:yes gene_type:complete
MANKKARPLSSLLPGTQQNTLKFPVNLDQTGHYVQFTAYERDRSAVLNSARGTITVGNKLPVENIKATFFLPMPANLGTAYNADYQNEDLGLLGAFIVDNAGTVLNAATEGLRQVGNAITSAVDGQGGAAVDALISGGSSILKAGGKVAGNIKDEMDKASDPVAAGGAVVGSVLAQSGIGKAKAILAKERGQAVNPHRVVLFQGVQFREHQFSYRLSPKNADETNIITSMIQGLKFYMLPRYGGEGTGKFLGRAFLDYPQIFQIKFKNDTHLFKMLPSVLKSINVQYHPMGYPAYIRTEDDVAPVEIEIQMTFQEIQMFTKEAVEVEVEGVNKAIERTELAFDEGNPF